MSDTLAVPIEVPEEATATQPEPQHATPCTMVILGASGDLTRRKLLPALFHLMVDGHLDEAFHMIGIGRNPMSDDTFRDAMRGAVVSATGAEPETESWERFAGSMSYLGGDLDDAAVYRSLRNRLEAIEREARDRGEPIPGRLFYLALPPRIYETTLAHLSESGVAPRSEDPDDRPWTRIIIEKPFGNSLESARTLNRAIRACFSEHQIYRIDHYLGKETVQNLLVFRFANSIFEPVWNRDHIHHVQITAAESVGVEHRAGYYEEAGVVRDMFQNHLIQLFSLMAMEPPVAFEAESVRTEKVKVLDAVRPIDVEHWRDHAVRGQYGPGVIDGTPVPGYRQEERVAPDSKTPTYAALRLLVDNWRWQGVPFHLRSGKRMPRRATEIAIEFRQPPHLMFPHTDGESIAPNVLTFRIQPDEGLSLCFEVKRPGPDARMATASMDFSYPRAFGPFNHSAYETLLVDCMLGDATLFTRSDGVEAAWRVVDPIIHAWDFDDEVMFPNYAAGEWGPPEAAALIARDGAAWRTP